MKWYEMTLGELVLRILLPGYFPAITRNGEPR